MEIEIDEFHSLQKQICDLQDCCFEWEKQALDYKAENIALSGELELTRKALDVAVDALKTIKFRGEHSKYKCCKMSGIIAQGALEQITTLEQRMSDGTHI